MSSKLATLTIARPARPSARAKPRRRRRRSGRASNGVPRAPGNNRRPNTKRTPQRLAAKKTQVLTELANRELNLEDAQAMYCYAANNAFTVRMPPISHSRNTCVPFNAGYTGVTVNTDGSYQLFVYRPSVKAMVFRYKAIGNATAWGTADAYDGVTLSNTSTNFDEIRVGLGAIAVRTYVTADVLQPIVFTGTISSAAGTLAAMTPDLMLTLPNCNRCPGLSAYAAWTPSDNKGLDYSPLPITTGPLSYDSIHWIMVYSIDQTVNKCRISVAAVSQCEGCPKAAVASSFPAQDVDAKHASWNIGDTMETVNGFIWRGVEAYNNAPPLVKSAVGQFMMSRLVDPNHSANRLMYRGNRHDLDSAPAFVTVIYDGARAQFTMQTLLIIFRNAESRTHFRDGLSDSDYANVLQFMEAQPNPPRLHWADESDVEDEKHVTAPHSTLTNSTLDLAQALRGLVNRTA